MSGQTEMIAFCKIAQKNLASLVSQPTCANMQVMIYTYINLYIIYSTHPLIILPAVCVLKEHELQEVAIG